MSRDCGHELHETPPLGSRILPTTREACPNCGSTAREYRVTGSLTVGAAAVAAATAPTVVLENHVGSFTRKVTWSKTPDCWLAEVHDVEDNIVGIEVALDAQDAFLLLDEHLLPPEM